MTAAQKITLVLRGALVQILFDILFACILYSRETWLSRFPERRDEKRHLRLPYVRQETERSGRFTAWHLVPPPMPFWSSVAVRRYCWMPGWEFGP